MAPGNLMTGGLEMIVSLFGMASHMTDPVIRKLIACVKGQVSAMVAYVLFAQNQFLCRSQFDLQYSQKSLSRDRESTNIIQVHGRLGETESHTAPESGKML